MSNYTTNYLKVVSKIYAPGKEALRYIRGEYMLNLDTKYRIVQELGSDAAILYEFFYERRRYNHFAPTNDEAIGKTIGWSTSKVTRIKSLLKANKLLLILKDTTRDGTTLYRTLLKKELIEYYEKHNELPEDIDIHITDVKKDSHGK